MKGILHCIHSFSKKAVINPKRRVTTAKISDFQTFKPVVLCYTKYRIYESQGIVELENFRLVDIVIFGLSLSGFP